MIKSLFIASFGKLKNFEIDFDKEFNYVVKENGYGKTTIASFIYAMFYGLNNSRAQSISNNMRLKYTPWNSNEKFGGSLTFTYEQTDYIISRQFGLTAIADTLTIKNVLTNKVVTEEFGSSVGYTVFGLTEESFLRCFFVPQEQVTLSNNDNFTSKLTQLLGTADCDKAIDLLDKEMVKLVQKKKRDGLKQGLLSQAEYFLEDLNSQLEDYYQKNEQLFNQEQELSCLKQNYAKALNREKIVSQQLLDMAESKSKYDANVMYNQNVRKNAQEKLDLLVKYDYKNFNANVEKVKTLLNEQTEQNNRIQLEQKKRNTTFITLMSVFGVLAVVTIVTFILSVNVLPYVCLVGSLLSVVLAFVNKNKGKTDFVDYKTKIEDLISPIQVNDGDYFSAINLLQSYSQQYEFYTKQIQQTLCSNVEGFDKNAYDQINAERLRLQTQLQTVSNDIIRLNTQISERKNNLIDVNLIKDKIKETEMEVSVMQERYANLFRAMQCLTLAKEKLATNFLPKMSKVLSQNVDAITNHKIQNATVDVNFNVEVAINGQSRQIDYFSTGIKEIIFFALRLTLSEIIYEDKIPFVLIDDAFVNYDDEKYALAKNYLKKMSKDTQIIYFSCQNRKSQLE